MDPETALKRAISQYLGGRLDLQGLYATVAELDARAAEGSEGFERLSGAMMQMLHEVYVEGHDEDSLRRALTLVQNPATPTVASTVRARVTLQCQIPQYAPSTGAAGVVPV